MRDVALSVLLVAAAAASALLAGCAAGPASDAPRRVEVSSALSDYNLSTRSDGQHRVWARSLAGFAGAHIVESEHTAAGWSPARPLPFADPRYRDSDPWLTPDGTTLYFISDRPLPQRPSAKDLNIWRVQRTAAGWGVPQPLGDEVNSEAEELGPELHDGVLYFGSNRRGGAGGLDIYTAAQQGDGFASARALPAPVNTAGSESDPTLSPDGRTLVFWRVAGRRLVLHRAERQGEGWGEPVPLAERFNPGSQQITPSFSADGRTLSFASDAGGTAAAGDPRALFDLYAATWR